MRIIFNPYVQIASYFFQMVCMGFTFWHWMAYCGMPPEGRMYLLIAIPVASVWLALKTPDKKD